MDQQPASQFESSNSLLHDQITNQKVAQAQQTLTFQDLSRKVCISRLPEGTTDTLVNNLLSCCGTIISWKRFQDAKGQPKDGGIAEFKDIKGVYACYKFLHNLELKEGGTLLLVKANQKTQGYFNDFIDVKREEYLDFLKE